MKTRTTAVVAAILGIGLAATGCSTKDDQPAAKLGTSSSPSPTASPSPTGPPEPTFNLPADLKVTIEPDTTGDPVKDQILRTNGYLIKGVLQAMAGAGAKDTGYQPYVRGEAALGHARELREFVNAGWAPTGSLVFYQRKVTLKDPTHASVAYCEDQRYAYGKKRSTGKVEVTKPTKNSFIAHATTVEKSSNGIWQETSFIWKRKAEECVRES
jgi:hypothetical protein